VKQVLHNFKRAVVGGGQLIDGGRVAGVDAVADLPVGVAAVEHRAQFGRD